MPGAQKAIEIHKIRIVTSTLFDPAFYVSELTTSKAFCFELQTINFGEQLTIDEHHACLFFIFFKERKKLQEYAHTKILNN